MRSVILRALQARGRKHTTEAWLRNFLFLADREAYLRLGRSLTGKSYRRMPGGPMPSRFRHVMAAMDRDGAIISRPLPRRDAKGRFAA